MKIRKQYNKIINLHPNRFDVTTNSGMVHTDLTYIIPPFLTVVDGIQMEYNYLIAFIDSQF